MVVEFRTTDADIRAISDEHSIVPFLEKARRLIDRQADEYIMQLKTIHVTDRRLIHKNPVRISGGFKNSLEIWYINKKSGK